MNADSDMVERVARVARAVYAVRFCDGKNADDGWTDLPPAIRDMWAMYARAALDASGIGELLDALERSRKCVNPITGGLSESASRRCAMQAVDIIDAALSRARATAEKGGAPDCPFCRSTFSGDPARSFCDEHYRQYLLTFQIVPKDLAAYRARATVGNGDG